MPIAYFDAVGPDYALRSASLPWSWLRQRESEALLHLTLFRAGDTVLDLGSGSGFYANIFYDKGASLVVAVDSAPSMIAALPDNIRGVVADAGSLALEERFDLVVCAGMIEFVSSPRVVFQAARRHLNEGGKVVVLYPIFNLAGRIYRFYHRRNGVRVRLCSFFDLNQLAESEGFEISDSVSVWPFTGITSFKPV